MFYFFMFLWFIFGIAFLITLIRWFIKKKDGKIVVASLIVSFVSLIISLVISVNEVATVDKPISNSNNPESVGDVVSVKEELIIDVVQFAKLTEPELETLLGKPESINEWTFSSSNGQKYEAVTWVYDSGNQEFMFIDDQVVRFTMYGTGQTYKDEDHALEIFGITPRENISKVADTGAALRYERVDVSMKVDDFWLVEDIFTDEENVISTVKVTYDSRYF